MKLDNYICYTKDDKIYSLGMELDSHIMQKKFTGGGLTKNFLRKNLGIPLSLFLINKKKSFFDDLLNEDNKKQKDKKKPKCITCDLFNKLINLRVNTIQKKKTKKHRKKKKKKTKKNLFIF